MKNKGLFIVWVVILIVIVSMLTYLGFKLEENNKNYEKLESKLVLLSEKYVEESNIQIYEGDKKIITSDELIELEYLDDFKYKKDVCTGYVEIELDEIYKYKAYISCPKYKTQGFNKNMLKNA